MAETAAKTTTTPRRTSRSTTPRKPATTKAATTKAAPAKTAAPAKEESAPAATTVDRVTIELEYVSDTKRYAKFAVPANLDGTMAGNLYVPLGTDKVKVAIFGVDADDFEVE